MEELNLDGTVRCLFYFSCLCPRDSVEKEQKEWRARKSGGQEGKMKDSGVAERGGEGKSKTQQESETTVS